MKMVRVPACTALMLVFLGFARSAAALPGGEVQGSVIALIRGQESVPPSSAFVDKTIFLPDITVVLKDTVTSAVTPSVTTNLDGTFTFPAQPQARYQLCWTATGFQPGCGEPFVLRSTNVYLKPVTAFALEGAIYGRVTLKDGTACRFLNPMMAKDTWTTVTASAAEETAAFAPTATANTYCRSGPPALRKSRQPAKTRRPEPRSSSADSFSRSI
jgi:hypothetical protein